MILRLCCDIYCLQAAQAFEEGLSELLGWIEAQRETLDNMAPPDEDANVLQEQIEENKVWSACATIMPRKRTRRRGRPGNKASTACSIALLGKNRDCSTYGKYVAGFIIISEHGNTTFSKRIYQAAVVSLQN